jgi:uncharacterized protein (TIGR03067 family)
MMGFMNRLSLLAILAVCGCTSRPPLPDARLILGEWYVVDFQSPMKDEDRGQRRKKAIITEGTWSQQFQGEQFEDFEYALDPTKSPKEIDLIYTASDGKRLTVRCIYELTADRLRVCLGSPPVVGKNGKPEYVESVRPPAFEVKDGPLITYRRATQ